MNIVAEQIKRAEDAAKELADMAKQIIDPPHWRKRLNDMAFGVRFVIENFSTAEAGLADAETKVAELTTELRRQSNEAWVRQDFNTADRLAALIGDKLPSTFEKEDLKAQHEEGGE